MEDGDEFKRQNSKLKCVRKTDTNGLSHIVDLVNAAYRGTQGERRWTTEAHLVQGDRLAIEDLEWEITAGSTEFYLGYAEERLVGCIGLKRYGYTTEFGTFAVDPLLHGYGFGKDLLGFAETVARTYSKTFQVTVVSQNRDLLQFYVRRGYQTTGQILAYPEDLNVGKPKVPNIDLTVLQKSALKPCPNSK
jgi:GNAT superfamily N-acetyltransferase